MFVGCQGSNDSSEKIESTQQEFVKVKGENEVSYVEYPDGEIDNEKIDNNAIFARYQSLNKKSLKYEVLKNGDTLFQYSNGFAVESNMQDLKPINDKRYKSILEGYSFYALSNSAIIPYDDAMLMIKKVLPDDIIEEKFIMSKEMDIRYIFYKSSKGNFIVGLNCSDDINPGAADVVDRGIIVGITYLKQIN